MGCFIITCAPQSKAYLFFTTEKKGRWKMEDGKPTLMLTLCLLCSKK